MEIKNYKLYFLICPVGGCVRYVGITKMSIKNRLQYHLNEYEKENPYKFRWIKKLKDQNLKPIIQEVCGNLTEEQACKIEADLISNMRFILGDRLTNIHKGGNLPPVLFGSRNPMYNSKRFGEKNPFFGKKHSQETKNKIGLFNKNRIRSTEEKMKFLENMKKAWNSPKDRRGSKNSMYGKKHSEDTKKKMSSLKVKKSVIQMNLRGEVLRVFEGVKIASRETGINDSSIIRVCKGRQKTAGGFVWKYERLLEEI